MIPKRCPVCRSSTIIRKENEGLSESTLEKFINLGWIKNLSDIYKLGCHYDELRHMEGFGDRSVQKLQESIEKSKDVELKSFIAALSIPEIGTSQSKELERYFTHGKNLKVLALEHMISLN